MDWGHPMEGVSRSGSYNFKYVPNEDFERAIHTFKRNQFMKDRNSKWGAFTPDSSSSSNCQMPKDQRFPADVVSIFDDTFQASSYSDVDCIIQKTFNKIQNTRELIDSNASHSDLFDLNRKKMRKRRGKKKEIISKSNFDVQFQDDVEAYQEAVKPVTCKTAIETVQIHSKSNIGNFDDPTEFPDDKTSNSTDGANTVIDKSHTTIDRMVQVNGHSKFKATDRCWQRETQSKLSKAEIQHDACVILTKITSYQEKICFYISEIRRKFSDVIDDDVTFDVKRCQKRFSEFCTRFSRNYLYQIRRMKDDIKEFHSVNMHIQAEAELITKVCNLFQMVLHAIQSYAKNMVPQLSPEKLKAFMDLVIDVIRICIDKRIFEATDSLIKRLLRESYKMLRHIVENQDEQLGVQPIKKKSKPIIVDVSRTKNSRQAHNKLAMYDKKSNFESIPIVRKSSQHVHHRKPLNKTHKKHIKNTDDAVRAPKRTRSCVIHRKTEEITTVIEKIKSDDAQLGLEPPVVSEANESSANEVEKTSKLFLEALQYITQKQVQETLAPLLKNFTFKQTTENLQKNIAALCSGCSTFDVGLNTEDTATVVATTTNNTCTNPVDCSTTKYTQNNHECGGAAVAASAGADVIVAAVSDQPSSVDSNDIVSVAASTKLKSPHPVVVVVGAKKQTHNILDTNIRHSKNVQYTYVVNDSSPASEKTQIGPTDKFAAATRDPHYQDYKEYADCLCRKVLRDRNSFRKELSRSSLYVNENFQKPWKLVSKIADDIVDQAMDGFEARVNFGEKSFVDDFLRAEFVA